MKSKKHIDELSPGLTEILKSELELGNEIVETSVGWPKDETILVFLRKPFHKTYSNDQIRFREINDPHYWKSEYFDVLTNHILACKFG